VLLEKPKVNTTAGTIPVWSFTALLATLCLVGAAWSEPISTFSPDRTLLATGHKDGTVKLWKVTTDAEQVTLYKPLDPDFSAMSALVWDPVMVFSPNGKLLATKRGDEPIILWAMPVGKEVVSLRGGGVGGVMKFSPDSKALVALSHEDKASGENTLVVWDVSTGKEKWRIRNSKKVEFREVAFSPDGKTLAALDGRNTVTVWDLQSGKQQSSLTLGAASGGK